MKQLQRIAGAWAVVLYALWAGLMVSGCQSKQPKYLDLLGNSSAHSQLLSPGNKFQVGDSVTVTFSGTSEQIPPHQESVKDDGTITLPYIGAVQALNKTPGELQKEIHDLYVPKYYRTLTVTVTSESQFFYVGGEVKLPNRYPYLSEITVLKAIQSAGDFTDFANRKKVRLTHANGQTEIVNCVKALDNPQLDRPVYPGDKIYVPRRFW